IERLVRLHRVKINVGCDAGDVEHLVEHIAMLRGHAHTHVDALAAQRVNDRKHFDRFRTSPENSHDYKMLCTAHVVKYGLSAKACDTLKLAGGHEKFRLGSRSLQRYLASRVYCHGRLGGLGASIACKALFPAICLVELR